MAQCQGHQKMCPVDNKERHLGHDGFLLHGLALGCCDGPDEHTEDCLGHNISDRIANLLCCRGGGTANSHHLHNVHTWVGQPRHGGQKAGLSDQSTCGLRLSLGGCPM